MDRLKSEVEVAKRKRDTAEASYVKLMMKAGIMKDPKEHGTIGEDNNGNNKVNNLSHASSPDRRGVWNKVHKPLTHYENENSCALNGDEKKRD